MEVINVMELSCSQGVGVGDEILNLDTFLYPSLLGKIGTMTKSYYDRDSDNVRWNFGHATFDGDFGKVSKEIVDFKHYPSIKHLQYEVIRKQEVKKFLGITYSNRPVVQYTLLPEQVEGDFKTYLDFDIRDNGEVKERFESMESRLREKNPNLPPILER